MIGKVMPIQEWLLIHTGNDGIMTKHINHVEGFKRQLEQFVPDRGDAFNFKINQKLKQGSRINSGDTVGVIHSSLIEQRLAELRALHDAKKNELKVISTGAKETLIEEARQQLQAARVHKEYQQKRADRARQLYEKNLTAREQYETTQSAYEQAQANEAVARSQLQNLKSGGKPSLIEQKRSEIDGIKNQIAALLRQKEAMVLQAPFDGVIQTYGASDTLCTILRNNAYIVVFPVEIGDLRAIKGAASVSFRNPATSETFKAVVEHTGNEVHRLNNKQMVLVTAKTKPAGTEILQKGMMVRGTIKMRGKLLREIVWDFVKGMLR